MNLYTKVELQAFLKAVDKELPEPIGVLMVGSGATQFGYGTTRGTRDLDIFQYPKKLAEPWERAQKKTRVPLPLDPAAIADAPWDMEDRVHKLDMPFKKLIVFVPEVHDIVLMKMLAWRPHDREAIREIAAAHTLDPQILWERYTKEMTHITGRQEDNDWKFGELIELVAGSAEAKKRRAALRRRRTKKTTRKR